MERYGTWYGAPVYKVDRNEYITCKLYDAVNDAFWITDEGYLVSGNKIKGKINQTANIVQVDDSAREVGRVYYQQPVKVELPAEKYNDAADEILNSVYTSKLWDEV